MVRIGKDPIAMTLLEILIVLVVLGILGLVSMSGFRAFRDAVAISGAVEDVSGRLAFARRLAVTRRERIRVRLRDGVLTLYSVGDSALLSMHIGGPGAPLDSIRLRPGTLRK